MFIRHLITTLTHFNKIILTILKKKLIIFHLLIEILDYLLNKEIDIAQAMIDKTENINKKHIEIKLYNCNSFSR